MNITRAQVMILKSLLSGPAKANLYNNVTLALLETRGFVSQRKGSVRLTSKPKARAAIVSYYSRWSSKNNGAVANFVSEILPLLGYRHVA